MGVDFTLRVYKELVTTLQNDGVEFLTFEKWCQDKCLPEDKKVVILRHDVDAYPYRALEMAIIENQLGVRATYYFRVVSKSNCPEVIKKIVDLGHEIGYHYEDLARTHGDYERAITHFKSTLNYFRSFYPVRTVAMHGSPQSQFDPRDLWKLYQYTDYGIIGEPYFDLDFSKWLYLTDSGMRWDGYKVIFRDKIPFWQDEWVRRGLKYHTTREIIDEIQNGRLKLKHAGPIMISAHPQHWGNSETFESIKWLVQGFENGVKWLLLKLHIRQ